MYYSVAIEFLDRHHSDRKKTDTMTLDTVRAKRRTAPIIIQFGWVLTRGQKPKRRLCGAVGGLFSKTRKTDDLNRTTQVAQGGHPPQILRTYLRSPSLVTKGIHHILIAIALSLSRLEKQVFFDSLKF